MLCKKCQRPLDNDTYLCKECTDRYPFLYVKKDSDLYLMQMIRKSYS
jgi:predicted amidophosphoribosyltransferase